MIFCGYGSGLLGLGMPAVVDESCVKSSRCCRNATCTFLISRCSVGVLTSVVGQLDGSCVSHCGPFHHSVDVERFVGSTPLETR